MIDCYSVILLVVNRYKSYKLSVRGQDRAADSCKQMGRVFGIVCRLIVKSLYKL